MGVTGLWKLIEPCGKPVPVETLEGKILAIDISIWLHQVVKGFQDSKGSALNNAHLLGLFNRLCKLMYYRVKPVFVFDGCVPQLKRDTIARRQQQRNKLNNEAERIQSLLLQSLAKEKVVQQALGANTDLLLKTGNKKIASAATTDEDDMFKLPELPSTSNAAESSYTTTEDEHDSFLSNDSSMEEANSRHAYLNNLQAIDVRSKHFKNLPADVRHEILVDIKETRKQSSWGRLHELPSKSEDFSTFQMKRLLKRRAVQESLEEAEQEMGGRTLTFAELQNYFTEEGIVEPKAVESEMKQICSDENTRILLVRDLKKKSTKIEEDCEDAAMKAVEESKSDEAAAAEALESAESSEDNDIKQVENEDASVKLGAAQLAATETEVLPDLGDEYNADLQLAIALSIEESQVYDENDYIAEGPVKLNRDQKQQLKNAAIGPARAYMIEYGGMNDEEVAEILDKTDEQVEPEENELFKELFKNDTTATTRSSPVDNTENIVLHVSDEDETLSDLEIVDNATKDKPISQELNLRVSDDSDSASDLEIVMDEQPKVAAACKTRIAAIDLVADETEVAELDGKCDTKATAVQKLEIVLDLNTQLSPKDDLFADIFETAQETKIETTKLDIEESEEVITETPTLLEVKSIFEKYRSPEKITKSAEKSGITPVKQKKADFQNILEELKQQANDVKNINLHEIQISSAKAGESNVEALTNVETKHEVIEIFDSEEQQILIGEASKSPTTPAKNKKIEEFFRTDYIVKRTPDKPVDETTTTTTTKISPFFKNKSTSPHAKRERSTAAAKNLFNEDAEVAKTSEPARNEVDIIKEAAEALRELKTDEELKSMTADLASQRRELEAERNRQERMGMSISQRMNSECQELLRLFGVPYIVAPMEAEAQCAFLDAIELTNGTITDDSDIWLFGGRTVYKNFFANNKHVMEFRSEHIEQSFHCDRNKLIQLACLVGSDYTPGIHGIGAVTGLEILATFSSPKEVNACQQHNNTNTKMLINKILTSLNKFRDWWTANKAAALAPGSSARLALLKKLKNIELYDGFPSLAVVEAYLEPKIDDSKETFAWGYPDVESIREFTKRCFGWTTTKTDEILTPVLKKLNEKKTQATIKNYFSIKSAHAQREMQLSKRLKKAVERMSGAISDEQEQSDVAIATTTKRKKRVRGKAIESQTQTTGEHVEQLQASTTSARKMRQRARKTAANAEEAQIEYNNVDASEPTEQINLNTAENAEKRSMRMPRIPASKQIIPQRERDMQEMAANKKKAAEILKRAPVPAKKKRNS